MYFCFEAVLIKTFILILSHYEWYERGRIVTQLFCPSPNALIDPDHKSAGRRRWPLAGEEIGYLAAKDPDISLKRSVATKMDLRGEGILNLHLTTRRGERLQPSANVARCLLDGRSAQLFANNDGVITCQCCVYNLYYSPSRGQKWTDCCFNNQNIKSLCWIFKTIPTWFIVHDT